MTPAEELAAAADKLTDRLKHTTPGPWEVYGDGDRRLSIVGGKDREYGVVEDYELNPDDAHYLAAMNPLVGEALAVMLRRLSEACERDARPAHDRWSRPQRVDDRIPGLTAALDLARLINGITS